MGAVSVQDSYLNFINGEFREPVSGKWLQRPVPADSTAQQVSADSDLMDVVRAVQASHAAYPNWMKTPAERRIELFLRIADLISERANEIATAVYEDLGTPEVETLNFSVPVAVAHFRAHAESLKPNVIQPVLNPIGLVGAIFPASDPFVCLASRVAPALAHGNVMVVKVSSQTPSTGVIFANILRDAEIPAGVFNLLQGRGVEVGEALLRHPGVSAVSFMGSTETGQAVALIAADAFKKIHYSLGAKNPVLVFANTDLAATIPKVARLCLGQYPSQALKGSRLFIQESIFKPALELLAKEIEAAKIAPLSKRSQVATYNEAVQLALKENGRVITSSSVIPTTSDQFVKPYLFADLTNCSTLQQNEIAGPLILASSFKYQHEALKYANVSPYGRAGFVFENDSEKAARVAQKLEVGSVFINTAHARFDPLQDIPLEKKSGFSPEGGRSLARFFTRTLTMFSLPH